MRWVPLLPWLLLVSAAAGCGGGGKTGGHDAGADVETADLQPDLSDHVVFPDVEVADIEADPDLVEAAEEHVEHVETADTHDLPDLELDAADEVEPPLCTPAGCDDQNECSKDGCDPAVGCTHEPVDGPCTGPDPCQTWACAGSQCVGTPITTDATNDGKDDDCDGLTDEDFLPTVQLVGGTVCGAAGGAESKSFRLTGALSCPPMTFTSSGPHFTIIAGALSALGIQ